MHPFRLTGVRQFSRAVQQFFMVSYFLWHQNNSRIYVYVARAGLVVLENRLKSDTTAVIGQLLEADIRTIMVTGN